MSCVAVLCRLGKLYFVIIHLGVGVGVGVDEDIDR